MFAKDRRAGACRAAAALAVLSGASGAGALAQEQAVPPAKTGTPPIIPSSLFAARSPFSGALLSPDGKRIAVSVEADGKDSILVLDAATKEPITRMTEGNDEFELEWFRWAGNDRILISTSGTTVVYGEEFRYTRLMVSDLVARTTTYVGLPQEGLMGDDVLYVAPDGSYVVLALQQSAVDEPEVRRFPLDGTKNNVKLVDRRSNVWDWDADDKGVVRVGYYVQDDEVSVLYRKSATDDFKVIARFSGNKDADRVQLYSALKIMGDTDDGLTLAKGPSGKIALRHVNLTTGQLGEVIYENRDADVTDFTVDATGRPVAAFYTDDRDRIAWLDPKMAEVQRKLENALAGQDLWIMSRAKDNSRMLVSAGAANDPGAFYIFTPATRTLDYVSDYRPGMPLGALAAVKPVTYTARDGTLIHAYLTLPKGREPKNLPLIIMPHGGPYGIRDKLDYNDEVQFLANRGYAVLQPNYRGSGGYGEAFEKLGDGQIGRTMQDDLDDAEDWAVKQGIADKDRVCIDGSSYGGYAALWGVERNPERYRCAASFAGVTDFNKMLKYDADFFSRSGRKKWNARVRGDKTFDMDSVSPARQAAKLTRPVLIAHGKRDSRVPFSQFKEMRNALASANFPQVDYLVFDKEGHGFDTAEDEQKWYDALEAFLKKYNPAN
jgi:dipeptidyl aminopeptidase/acylaminoacyl peptidase